MHLNNCRGKFSSFLPYFAATGKVLALELPKHGNEKCTVLYPASAKASHDIGMCFVSIGFCIPKLFH